MKKKIISLCLGICSLMAVSIYANSEPASVPEPENAGCYYQQVPCDTVNCNQVPCDSINCIQAPSTPAPCTPVPCTPAPCM